MVSKRSDEHSLKRALYAGELNRRAGGDINKILPALDDMLAEAKEKREKEETETEPDAFDW